MNWRKLSKSMVLSVAKNYAQSASFAAWINAITFYLMCMGRRLNDRFVFIFIPFLPCWIASQLSWLMPPQVLHFFVTGITPAVSIPCNPKKNYTIVNIHRQWKA